MQFRRQLREEESINLTPLIDVVFLLLIFFMVSTTFTKESHLSIDLPEASGEPQAEQGNGIEILINADGSYAVNGRALVNMERATIMSALNASVVGGSSSNTASTIGADSNISSQTASAKGIASTPLVITADAKAPHEAVVRAMDAAGQVGFVQLSITTRKPTVESSAPR